MNRCASLAPELLIGIVKACVESQVSYWNINRSTMLAKIANKCFAWPNGIADETRKVLRLEAMNALLKVSIVKIPMEFSLQNTITIPPLLVERQEDLRRLTLDLHTTPVDGMYNRECNKAIKSMPALRADFPKLEVFVLSIYFHCRNKEDMLSFKKTLLRMRNLKRMKTKLGWGYIAFEDTVLEVVATFAQSGPGRRKLIRFGSMPEFDAEYDVGPLMEAIGPAMQVNGETNTGNIYDESGCEDDLVVANAKRIFNQAYHAPRDVRRRQA